MKYVKLFAVLFAGFAFAQAQAGDPEAGAAKAAVCAACHGPDGNSPSSEFPKIAGQGERYFVKQLKDYKSGARDNALMRAQVAALSEQDMKDLAAFYAAQTADFGEADPELVALGERLYRGGNLETGVAACAACHGPAGQGMAAAGWPLLAGQHARYTEQQMRAFRAAGREDLDAPEYRQNDPEGMMRGVAARMTDREIRAVSSFIQGLSK